MFYLLDVGLGLVLGFFFAGVLGVRLALAGRGDGHGFVLGEDFGGGEAWDKIPPLRQTFLRRSILHQSLLPLTPITYQRINHNLYPWWLLRLQPSSSHRVWCRPPGTFNINLPPQHGASFGCPPAEAILNGFFRQKFRLFGYYFWGRSGVAGASVYTILTWHQKIATYHLFTQVYGIEYRKLHRWRQLHLKLIRF